MGAKRPAAASLERAIELYVSWQEGGANEASRQALLADYPDLREYLEALFSDRDLPDAEEAGSGPGTILGGYRILGELGRGGMGVVYDAYDSALDRRVALKVLTAHVTLQPSAVARFKREALAAARLDHPGIVKILSVGGDGDTHWFAMERIEGRNLAESRPGSLREAAAIGASLADALSHAHAHGVLHRDVKPSNVLMRGDGQPVLTDFGLARETSLPSLTRTGGFLGTPFYVSPEQAQGHEVDARSDVFSLGATLYELCVARLPFDAAEPQQVIAKILREEPPDPCRVNPKIDRDLGAILLRALEKPPARRYPSTAAMALDLRAWLAGEPVAARMPSSVERVWRWARREPARAGLALALALGLPAIAALVGYQIANAPVLEAGRAEERRRVVDLALARGFLAHADEDGVAAREAFGSALELEPSCAEARLGTAMSLLAERQFDSARAALDGSDGGGGAFERVRAQIARAEGKVADAERLERELPEPKGSLAHFAAGTLLFDRGRLNEDLKSLRAALRHFSQAALAAPAPRPYFHFQLARCAEWAKDEAAESEAVAAIESLWPNEAAALRQIGERVMDVDPAKAVQLLRERLATARPEQRGRIAYDIALAHQMAKDYVAAAAAYRESIAFDPGYAPAHNNLGLALEECGQRKEAMAAYRAGLVLHPGAHKMHNNVGRLLRRMNRQDDAIESYEAAITARPDYAVAWFNLGNALAQKGAQEKAMDAFRQAITSDPGYARAHANLGELLLWQDREADAIPALREAVRLTPSEIIPRMHLAEAFCRTGDHAGARAQLEASVTNAPKSADAWTAFAAFLIRDDLAESARDPALAVVAARKAVDLAKDKRAATLLTLAEAQLVCGDVPGARQTLERAESELAATPQPRLVERAAAVRARLEAAASGSRPASRPDHR